MTAPVTPLTRLLSNHSKPMKHILKFMAAAAPLSALPTPSSLHSSISTLAEMR